MPVWQTTRFAIDLAHPRVMGIVNLTPDSFSDGDPTLTPSRALARCEQLLAEGADLLDLGAESSRPGAEPVDASVELARLLPVLEGALRLGCPVSVDTTKAEVMRVVLGHGADIVNDIGALRAPDALEVVAGHGSCGVCLMHMRATPRSMQADTEYEDVVAEVRTFLDERVAALRAAGIAEARIAVDPGIGFAKTAAQNLALLERQDELILPGVTLLVGWSRKSTLARLAGLASGADRHRSGADRERLAAASVAAALLAVDRGARVVRVHDVAQTVSALAVWRAVRGGRG